MNQVILTSKDVMNYLKVSENTLISYEKQGYIIPDFRLGNRKRYYESSIMKSLERMKKLGS